MGRTVRLERDEKTMATQKRMPICLIGTKRLKINPLNPMVTLAALMTIARPVVFMIAPSPDIFPLEHPWRLHAAMKWIA